ncbi:protein NRT1/ PTR FAMILY 5.6-like, partial [Neltuma alba]|uniref:protein NRT1/ PTR FAMILY 5.6-like n=1 Tax=Neltuma alba TaxID=207710 RepID=UPI0010A457A9
MEKKKAMEIEGGGVEVDETKWVYDSSLDHKGRLPLRASTGSWKAALFIIAIEFSERLSYFGIATSLVLYLTKVIHEDLKTAARNVNYWSGVTTLMPLLGGFVADAYLGRYFTVFASCVVFYISPLRPCDADTAITACTKPRMAHEVAFFFAIYLLSIGTGGHKPSLESFGADQFDDDHATERRQK